MWNHCRDVENPADIGCRGEGATKLKSNVLLWKGPSWLSKPMENWPSSEECFKIITEECCVELKKGQAIEAVGEAVLLTKNGTPSMDTFNSNYRFHLLRQAVSYYSLGVALCEKFLKSRPSY